MLTGKKERHYTGRIGCSLQRNRRSAAGKRKWSISQIGRLSPTGINTPVKKVVGSVAQVGNQDDR